MIKFPFLKPRQVSLPWLGLPSIFPHIQSRLDQEGKLPDSEAELPDDQRLYQTREMKWAPGAFDGAFSHHFVCGAATMEAKKAAILVRQIAKNDRLASKVELYELLRKDNLLEYLDPALEIIHAWRLDQNPNLKKFAEWLAFESPDRGPVKFGIALLGIIGARECVENIMMLGKHEEFTLYAAVALDNILEDPERELLKMAKYVDGWGRVHVVERLGKTQDPEIKKWLLRNGCKGGIMDDYIAPVCAEAGDLINELCKPEIDEELLKASGLIIDALIDGALEEINNYADGPELICLYVAHLGKQAGKTGHFYTLNTIKNFLEDEDTDWNKKKRMGWTQDLRVDLLIDIHKILGGGKIEIE